MAFQAGAEADYRYAHALYNMAERIRDRHPRVAAQLEKAADALLLALYNQEEEEDHEPDGAKRQDMTEQRLARRLGVTFHASARRPSRSSPRP